MTDEQELIDFIATKVMGWTADDGYWKGPTPLNDYGVIAWIAAWNPVANPADCAGVKAKWLENPRHEYTIKAYWLETGKTYGVELLNWPLDDTAVPARWLGRSGTEEHAFCLAVKAAWEAKDV